MPEIPVDDNSEEMMGEPNDMPVDDSNTNMFDNDFDAGVEADEENDPKRYIQQLTGKLSQKLRDYNESLGEPDSDLNKYVAGMIVKQAVDGLDETDRSEIIKKVSDEQSTDNEESSNNVDSVEDDISIDNNEMPMESKKRAITCTKKQLHKLSENFGGIGDILNAPTDRIEKEIPKTTVVNKVNKPFMPPKFK